MRNSIRIALLELKTLFYSPVAWLVLLVFAFQAGLQFNFVLNFANTSFQASPDHQGSYTHTFFLFTNIGIFVTMQDKLFLVIPLLTMGLLSREMSSGSIKLLLSSPVRLREIVLGKYLAMMGYGLVLLGILLLYVLISYFCIPHLDIGRVFSGLLGIYILLCTYAAIGLFMSSLTAYQVVAAISTIVMLAALNYVGTVGQEYAIMRALTKFLSITGRADQLINGLLVSSDIVYFLLVITFFLGCCVLKLQSERKPVTFLRNTGRYSLLFAVIFCIGYISTLPLLMLYEDMTADDELTLTPASQEVIKKIHEPLIVTSYVNLLDNGSGDAMPKMRRSEYNRFAMYRRFLPNMQLKYVYYYDSLLAFDWVNKADKGLSLEDRARKKASIRKLDFDLFLSPDEIRKTIDLRKEGNVFVRQLSMGGKSTFLRNYTLKTDWVGQEQNLTTALKRLVAKPPVIGFVQGHLERSMDKTGEHELRLAFNEPRKMQSLINQGFDVVNISLAQGDIPSDLTVLFIADPKVAYTTQEIQKIDRYIRHGGNLMLLCEPGKQSIVNPLLNLIGVRLLDGLIVQQSTNYLGNFVLSPFTEEVKKLGKAFDMYYDDGYKLAMTGTAGFAIQTTGNFRIRAICTTDPKDSWLRMADYNPGVPLVYSSEKGDQRAVIPTALTLTRTISGKQQKIIVFGDADFMTQASLRMLATVHLGAPGMFYWDLFQKWFSEGEFPVEITRPEKMDNKLSIRPDGVRLLSNLQLILLPLLIGGLGSILLIKRKHK